MSERIRILHLITDLYLGGAELMLYKLVSRMDRSAFEIEVGSLTEPGVVGDKIRALDLPLGSLGMRRGLPNPLGLARLVRKLRRNPPDLIQTWMYHADLVGGLAAWLAGGRVPVVWGIRNSTLEPGKSKRSTIWTAQLCARLSRRLTTGIVCCSKAAWQVHEKWGYTTERIEIIPNGFDLQTLKPDPDARQSVGHELNLAPDALLIGLVARFDPQKDHATFIQAAGKLASRFPQVQFLLCGGEVTPDNPVLRQWIVQAGIESRCHLLGPRDDIPRLTAALDVATLSSSYGEAFPNAVGEAMACGVPCVVTDVGDSKEIVGETGKVIPVKDPEALAEAWGQLIDLGEEGRRGIGAAARRRMEQNFDLDRIARTYEAFYRDVLSKE